MRKEFSVRESLCPCETAISSSEFAVYCSEIAASRTFSVVNNWVLRGQCDRLQIFLTLYFMTNFGSFCHLSNGSVDNYKQFCSFASFQWLMRTILLFFAHFQVLSVDNFDILAHFQVLIADIICETAILSRNYSQNILTYNTTVTETFWIYHKEKVLV